MVIWMAVLLAAAGLPPEDEFLPRSLQDDEDPKTVTAFFTPRVGGWAGRHFAFQATRTDNLQVSSQQQAFVSTSALAGIELYEHFVVMGMYEASFASKITVQVGGAYIGWREHPKERYGKGVPDEAMIYAGVLVGHLDVHVFDFGEFDRAIGFAGGLELGWSISSNLAFELYAEYRLVRFEYLRPVSTGNTSMGGSTIAFGIGLDLRF